MILPKMEELFNDSDDDDFISSSATTSHTLKSSSTFILNELREFSSELNCRNVLNDVMLIDLSQSLKTNTADFKLITSMDLSNNCLTAISAAALATSFQFLLGLKMLNLSENSIGSVGAGAIFGSLSKIGGECKLTSLSLSQNKIESIKLPEKEEEKEKEKEKEGEKEGVKEGDEKEGEEKEKEKGKTRRRSFNTVDSSLKLKVLNLSGNSLTNEIFLGSNQIWPQLTFLRELNLGWNNLNDAGAISLASIFLNPAKMRLFTLELPFNGISDVGGVELAKVIAANKFLRSLDLARNRIREETAMAFAGMEGNCTLKTLKLGFNELGEVGTKALVNSLERQISLVQLMVENTCGESRAEVKELVREVIRKRAGGSERLTVVYVFPE